MKTKRALIRAVEKQAEMEERMDLLKVRLCVFSRSYARTSSSIVDQAITGHPGN